MTISVQTGLPSNVLKPAARWPRVLRAQVRATRDALVPNMKTYVGLLGLGGTLLVYAALDAARRGVAGPVIQIMPAAAVPIALFALFVPFGVWRGDAPSHRAYHLSMPMAQGSHSLLKLLAGWVWVMAAVAGYVVFLHALIAVMPLLSGTRMPPDPRVEWWAQLVPFTAATVTYLIGSFVAIAVDQASRWMLGLLAAVPVAIPLLARTGRSPISRAVMSLIDGEYGIVAAGFGGLYLDRPQFARWIVATAIWLLATMTAVIFAARWRRDV